ncbi:hypothetical protein L2E82_33645 [Cichorium intybus]|uniref:Uncharacterized protein n=1 Tax=Cichorium intybus TaxID=13427 RepID=A0ACB9BL40_CICIN|nr:hypothetical protein L2E82_33645 [Cichorium intybus]
MRREVVAVIGGCSGDGDWFHGRIMVRSMKNNESGLNPNPDLALASRDYIWSEAEKKSACLKIGVFEDVRRSVLNPLLSGFENLRPAIFFPELSMEVGVDNSPEIVGVAMEFPVVDGAGLSSPPTLPPRLRRRLTETKASPQPQAASILQASFTDCLS